MHLLDIHHFEQNGQYDHTFQAAQQSIDGDEWQQVVGVLFFDGIQHVIMNKNSNG